MYKSKIDRFLNLLVKIVFAQAFFGILVGIPSALIASTSTFGFLVLVTTLIIVSLGAITTMAIVALDL